MNRYLTEGEWLRAVMLWKSGQDTAQIAAALDVPEPLIYAKLPTYRAKYRTIGEVAA